MTQAQALLEGQTGDAVLAEEAYDRSAVRALIAEMRADAVIPSKKTERSASHTTSPPTSNAIGSSGASIASNISVASQRPSHRPLYWLFLPRCGNDLDAVNVDWS